MIDVSNFPRTITLDSWQKFRNILREKFSGRLMGQFQIRAKICVSKRRTKILIKLKDRAILCVKSGEFMVFPTVAFSAGGRLLAIATLSSIVGIWDLSNGHRL